jgi:prevent-host-death family protein
MAWQLQEAKQRFSHVVDQARAHGPQVVTRRGKEVAVVLSIEEYRKITGGSLLAALSDLAPVGGDVFADILDEIVAERQLPMNLPRTPVAEP